MPDIGWMELMVIGIVALIVVGPKDLPQMFKKFGQIVGRLRAMGREFTQAMNDAADDSGMSDISRDMRAAAKYSNPNNIMRETMSDLVRDIDPTKFDDGSATRSVAERKASAQAAIRSKVEEVEAARAAERAEESFEPDEPSASDAEPERK